MKISNLKSLKGLGIQQNKQTESHIEEIYNFQFPNLETLKLKISRPPSLQILAEIFKNLKTFYLNLPQDLIEEEYVSEIFQLFNQVENISITTWQNTKIEFSDTFFSTRHSNPNLKTVQLLISTSNMKNWLRKVKNDFPNAENFIHFTNRDLYNHEFIEEHNKQHLEYFTDSRRYLFYTNVETIENASDVLKNCSYEFFCYNYGLHDRYFRVIRDGKNYVRLLINKVRNNFIF